MKQILEKAKEIKCLICDVDGVLTDGLLHIDNFGNELKSFHVLDGMGLKFLMAAGIEVAVITTSINAVIDHRMAQTRVLHDIIKVRSISERLINNSKTCLWRFPLCR